MKSFNPIIVIPSYNTGADLLRSTVKNALAENVPVKVVIDGSSDGSDSVLAPMAESHDALSILRKKKNTGKGDAILLAARQSLQEGYTHALIMDSDGQHPADMIPTLIEVAYDKRDAIVMGQPVFGDDAPPARVFGRKLTIFWTSLETLWSGLGDTLFGMRVYPLESLLAAFEQTSFARGFEFDPEIAVRMVWSGCRPIKMDVPVKYLSLEEGGVSHFHYLRDNVKLTLLHFRLVPELIFWRVVPLLLNKRRWKKS